MAIDHQRHRLEEARKPGLGIGLLKSMAVTFKHLFKRATANVIQYPDQKQDLAPRTRGVIALKEENCTVCMLCGRECPDWCIYIDSHKESLPPKREGGRPRKRNVLDRFAIDYALCMYCGICVEVCPYDALFWSREYEFAEYDIREMTHEKERLSDWMATVLPPPALEEGALLPGQPMPEASIPEAPPVAAAPAAMPPEARAEAEPKAPPAEERKETPAGVGAPGAKPVEQTTPEAATAQRAGVGAPGAQPVRPPPSPTGPPASSEEAEAIYQKVLKEQREAGASPQVAEARAKVARVKAERGIGRPPTPVETEKRVPSAPTKHEISEPKESGAPDAEEPKPEQGPVAPTDEEKEK
jgi:formate hydrogenlyase subunit 6/NADH:ubiquinone oxidoreductase subunit I